MWKYFEPVAWLVLFVFIASLDVFFYYAQGLGHSWVPLGISSVATLVVGILAGMAIYETFKHRNDKEPW